MPLFVCERVYKTLKDASLGAPQGMGGLTPSDFPAEVECFRKPVTKRAGYHT